MVNVVSGFSRNQMLWKLREMVPRTGKAFNYEFPGWLGGWRSSQSRTVTREAADTSVSVDLMIRSGFDDHHPNDAAGDEPLQPPGNEPAPSQRKRNRHVNERAKPRRDSQGKANKGPEGYTRTQ